MFLGVVCGLIRYILASYFLMLDKTDELALFWLDLANVLGGSLWSYPLYFGKLFFDARQNR